MRAALVLAVVAGVGAACASAGGPAPTPARAVARVPARPPAAAYTHYVRGQLHRLNGNPRQALHELESALEFDPGSPYLQIALGEVRFEQGALGRALDHCREALARVPSFAPAYLLMGRIHQSGRNYPLAVEAFEQAVRAASGAPDAYLALGVLHREYGRATEAARTYERMAERIPDSAEARFLLGELASDRGDYEDAERHYRLALLADPLLTDARRQLAWVLDELERHAEAIAEHTTVHDDDPADEEVVYSLARLHLRHGPASQADHYLDLLRETNAGDTETLTRIGETCFEAQDYGRAAAAFAEALAADGKLHKVRVWLGASRYASGDAQGALQALSEVPEGSEWYDDARRRVAGLLQEQGSLEDAARIYASVLAKRPKDPGLYQVLSEVYAELGRYDEAFGVVRRGLERMPGDPHLRYHLATLHARSGHWEGAVGRMERLLRDNAEHVGALVFLARAFADRGVRLEEAERYAEKASSLRPNSADVAAALGWIHWRRGRPEDALVHLQEARRLAPRDVDVLERLAIVYRALRREEDAQHAEEVADELRAAGPAGSALSGLPELE